MTQTKEKWDDNTSGVDVTFEWYENAMVFRVLIFIFLFKINEKKGHLDKNDFHTVMEVFPKMLFWKLLDHSDVQSSFSTIMRHIDNSILKDTLQLKVLRTRIRSNSFIKTWVNMMEQKPAKVSRKL